MAQSPDLSIPFDRNKNVTATYGETIDFYRKLAAAFPKQVLLSPHGSTDSGHPLHTVVLSIDGIFDPVQLKQAGKSILLVNNAIHPGEPCGVEASMQLLRDYLHDQSKADLLKEVVIVVIPYYNIGGGLNRGAYSRANQLGPEEHGFRGNAKNLDLNRDFIKCDTRNARTFNQIFNYWQPDIFIDNHTSNGADYQYTITLIPTQHNKLSPVLAQYLQEDMLPQLYEGVAQRGWDMTPYVYARSIPDEGIAGFLDLARYSSGYAALHHTISFMPETHMLKPFADRVASVYAFMDAMIQVLNRDGNKIRDLRGRAFQAARTQKQFAVNWQLDQERSDTITFKGYEAGYKKSAISGLDRLYYDRNKPFEKQIPHFNYYKATQTVEKPSAYIIPQAYREVLERLHWNGVRIHQLTEDLAVDAEFYYIEEYQTSRSPYEGHYMHSQVQVRTEHLERQFHAGDYVVFTGQPADRFLVEVLEPQGADSYFAWNFFDGILMQKEHFSSYVFEDLAADYLDEHPDLKNKLDTKRKEDSEFANSARAQLNFIYENSPYYEPTYKLYPVGRMKPGIHLPVIGVSELGE
ncbi:M14 family zinc carboxypeptidase [Flavilitoribacter nigricans]|nr:M14 family zinc carboxypeptidase [Flavilitoribacter nigricans]